MTSLSFVVFRGIGGALVLTTALWAAGGCGPQKTVTIASVPAGARVTLLKTSSKQPNATPVSLSSQTTPVTVDLPFGAGERYTATLSKEQFLDGTVPIALEPQSQKDYRVTLRRYLDDLPQTLFAPRFDDRAWVLEPRTENTTAYVLDARDPGVRGKEAVPVTTNIDPDVDFQSIAASPTSDLLVYQRVERRAAAPVTFTVPPGSRDGVAQLAQAQGVSTGELLRANPNLDPERRPTPGTTLRVVRTEVVSEIYKHSGRGGTATRLTNDRAAGLMELTPAFDGTGDAIIFSSNTSSPNPTLWSMRVEGGGSRLTRVTQSGALDYQPSVGGESLAYTSLPPRGGTAAAQLWVAKANGTDSSKVGDGESPAVSPDDRRIAFVRRARDRSTGRAAQQLWLVNADGTAETRVTSNLDYDVVQPRWSPDARWIVYAANPGPGGGAGDAAAGARPLRNYDLYRVPADGGTPERLTSNPASDTSPAVDSTGSYVYFRSNRAADGTTAAWNIWRIELPPAVPAPSASAAAP